MDSKVGGCRITSTFNDKSLDAVLNVLKATIDVNIVKSGSSIQISANAGK
jgi:ferric-dicitrate binding protein FerR (iron transport regulator)